MSDDGSDESFDKAMHDVTRLSDTKKIIPSGENSRPSEAQLRARLNAEEFPSEDENPLSEVEPDQVLPDQVLEWKQTGVQNEVMRKLKQGSYEATRELDLHGKFVEQARAQVFQFIQRSQADEHRCVRIAHGRGVKSKTPARLKSFVAYWLIELPQVIGYCSAPQNQGGTGAVLVLLKKAKIQKAD